MMPFSDRERRIRPARIAVGLGLALILAGCLARRRDQVSFVGPVIEGVRQIHLVDSSGDNLVALFVDQPNLGGGLVWAPDGEQAIVFAGPEGQARLADIESGSLGACLTCGIPDPGEVVFSPDGSQIAVGSADGLYVANRDGIAARLVSELSRPGWIQWLGEGWQIGFAVWDGSPNVVRLDLSSGESTSLTARYESSGLSFFSPQWSPDGESVAVRTSSAEGLAIQIMAADGSSLTKLADWEFRGEFLDPGQFPPPQWSPDGTQILFTGHSAAGDSEIYLVNRDGSGLANLTNSPGADSDPVWSPNGRQIAFVSSRDGDREIYVMNADGSEPHNVSNRPLSDEFSPAWRPTR